VRTRWFAPRSLVLHVLVVAWVAGCAAAAYWQVGRAVEGNALSYAYAVEWPAFAVLGVLGWWGLVHADKIDDERREERRAFEERMRTEAQIARRLEDETEDADLAAYNDHLDQLASQPKRRLWGH
jgi:DNA-binding transcriptional regulator of glucitol operon